MKFLPFHIQLGLHNFLKCLIFLLKLLACIILFFYKMQFFDQLLYNLTLLSPKLSIIAITYYLKKATNYYLSCGCVRCFFIKYFCEKTSISFVIKIPTNSLKSIGRIEHIKLLRLSRCYLKTQNNCLFLLMRVITSPKRNIQSFFCFQICLNYLLVYFSISSCICLLYLLIRIIILLILSKGSIYLFYQLF